MRLETWLAAFRAPHKRALLSLVRVLHGHARFLCLASLEDTGVLRCLVAPSTVDEVADRCGIERTDLLRALLDLGTKVGLVRRRGDRYRCRGALATALANDRATPVGAFLREQLHYHGAVFRELSARLRGAPDGDYLPAVAPLIAEGSRMVEPFLRPFVRRMLRGRDAPRILEVGCGDGAYLAWYAADAPGANGIALDVDAAVADRARAGLRAAGIDAFDVVTADVFEPRDALDGRFDVITLFQNIYYFAPDDRARLFTMLRDRLAPGGVLAIATATRSARFASHYFEVLLASTVGCWPLPDRDALESDLRTAGFTSLDRERLVPGDAFFGWLAR